MDLVTVLLSIIVILFLVNVFTNKRQGKYSNFPPGPKPLPILGNVFILDMSKPHKTFYQLSKEYGSIFSIQMGMTKMVILCGYNTIKDALINNAEVFSERPYSPLFDKTAKGHGIVFSNGENWKVMRRFTLSTLRDYGMGKRTIEEKIIEEAEFLVQKMRSYEGKPFGDFTSITGAVTNIIVAILLNKRFEYGDPTILRLMGLVNENVKLLGSPWVRLYNSYSALMDRLPGPHRTIFENTKEYQNFIRSTFTKYKKELDVNDQRNLIDTFLSKQLEGKQESTEYYHNDNLTVLVGDLFGAGMETTSTTLRWSILLMMAHPEIQKKVQDEIDRVIGSAQIQMEHRKQLPYTDAVVHEIQRFGDIAPTSVPHVASQDVTFKGYFIPKGTTILPVLHSIHMDKEYFEKPNEFYPEHFMDSEGNFKKNEAFIPFSIGKRSCAGETLAKMEIFLFFTTLVQHFTFKAPPGAKLDLTPAFGSTNSPKPFEVCAIPRHTPLLAHLTGVHPDPAPGTMSRRSTRTQSLKKLSWDSSPKNQDGAGPYRTDLTAAADRGSALPAARHTGVQLPAGKKQTIRQSPEPSGPATEDSVHDTFNTGGKGALSPASMTPTTSSRPDPVSVSQPGLVPQPACSPQAVPLSQTASDTQPAQLSGDHPAAQPPAQLGQREIHAVSVPSEAAAGASTLSLEAPIFPGAAARQTVGDIPTMDTSLLQHSDTAFPHLQDSLLEGVDRIISSFISSLKAIEDRALLAESKLGELISSHNSLSEACQRMDEQSACLNNKIVALEDYIRRNNLKIQNVPESIASSDLPSYVKRLIKHALPSCSNKELVVDWAHRVPRPKHLPRDSPRDVIVRVHYLHIKNTFLAATRRLDTLSGEYQGIAIFSDLSPDTLKRRRAFAPFTKHLRDTHVQYKWINSAHLLVTRGDNKYIVTDPGEGLRLMDAWNSAKQFLMEEEKREDWTGVRYPLSCPPETSEIPSSMELVTVLLSIVVIFFLVSVFNEQKRGKYKNFPPGPKPLPILGNLLMMDMSKPYKTFYQLSKEFGSVFSVQMGMTKMVVLCGYDTIKDALINNAEVFSDRPHIPLYKMYNYNLFYLGIIFANGENWRVMRRFALSTLRDYGMGKKTIQNKIIEEAECLVQKLRSYEGKPFGDFSSITGAVTNIIVAILLSKRFDYEDPTILRLMGLINESVRLLGSPWATLYNSFPALMDRLPGGHKTIAKNVIEFCSFIRATFTKHKKELDINDQRNLIDAFLAKQQEGKQESTQYFHNENLIVLVGDLFGAAMDTTSSTLRWSLLLMIKYPEIQKKVHDEIDKVIGSAQPQMEHRKQMPYTDAVIHEIQRFGDIAPIVLHATSQDVTYRGYFIPKGTPVLPVLHSIHMDKAYFEKPDEFYPEHFLDSEGNFKKNEAFIPFSIGKRSCAGETLAKMEIFLFFTTLFQNLTFKARQEAQLDLTPALGSTNSPKPFEICAIPRI
ncbi:uncharacterized protein [Dendropsophus ebraccatus]|uniref:uncharacterized protein n=1 Tax=Dendropsophus ebraccatus TaxID=150705 RepID=UPI003831067E